MPPRRSLRHQASETNTPSTSSTRGSSTLEAASETPDTSVYGDDAEVEEKKLAKEVQQTLASSAPGPAPSKAPSRSAGAKRKRPSGAAAVKEESDDDVEFVSISTPPAPRRTSSRFKLPNVADNIASALSTAGSQSSQSRSKVTAPSALKSVNVDSETEESAPPSEPEEIQSSGDEEYVPAGATSASAARTPSAKAKGKLKAEPEDEKDDEDIKRPVKRTRLNADAGPSTAAPKLEGSVAPSSDEEFVQGSDEGSDEEWDSDGSSLPAATTAEGGFYAEEQQYETQKQRAKRIRSERAAKRRKKPVTLTHAQKTTKMLEKEHPELARIWKSLQASATVDKKKAAEQPTGLTVSLLPFQLEGLHWLKHQEQSDWKGGILADEMGMGKTIQMISLFLSDRRKPTLVVAPTVAILQWRNEIAKYTQDFKVLVWHGATREVDFKKLQEYDVVLTSFAVLESAFRKQETGFKRKGEIVKEVSPVHSVHWYRIVLDEAHNIKERATNTAKGAFALKGTYRWCLSGTPLQNRVGELYSMIRFLNGDPYAYYYCKRCPCKSLHWQFSDRRSCDKCGHTPMHHVCLWNVAILKPIQRSGTSLGEGADAFRRLRLLLDKVMLRRTKIERADDMGLPPLTIVTRKDYFNEEEEDLYDSLYKDGARKFSTYLDQGTVLNNYSNIFTLLTRMRQIACHPDLVLRSKTGIAKKLIGDAANEAIHLCRICAEEATEPIVSKCRHVFCRECVRQYLDTHFGSGAPDCPYCHATLSIDLEQEALEETHGNETRQGILSKIDLDKWRSSTKIEALLEELNSVRSEDCTIKSIVFSQFVNFLDLIAFRLQRAGFKICRLEGTMSPEARDRTIKYFMETPDVTVFLVSLKAGGVALNLTEASRVYLMDPWWNPSVSMQAFGRIHRLGQHRPIVVKEFIVENSIESRILELQSKKSAMVKAALANDDSAMGRLSVNDLKFLFTL